MVGTALIGPSQGMQVIPPGHSKFEYKSVIGPTCTQLFPSELNVVQFIPHMHNVGVGFEFSVVRNGQIVHEYQWKYDFNKQGTYNTPGLKVKPGDSMIINCIYDTSGLTDFTYGGESSSQEMCYAIFDYWPRIGAPWRGMIFK